MFHVPEQYRYTSGDPRFTSTIINGNNGVFILRQGKTYFQCIASDGLGWEHVSVTLRFKNSNRFMIPSWEDMCYIKSIFWDEEDTVLQYHPAKTDYINNHEDVLHLWRPVGIKFPKPHSILVGVK